MKQHLDVVLSALDKANKSGVFNLQESNSIIVSYSKIEEKLKQVQTKEDADKVRGTLDKGDPHKGEA